MKKLAVILGTRPEIIKMAPVILECQRVGMPFFILHTGQHYTPNMDAVFFTELGLPQPEYNLGLGGLNPYQQIGRFTREIASVLKKERPDTILVQGDTTTVLAGALAAVKLGMRVAHHEAGLRSRDLTMPEEVNRLITDHVSDFLFAPTKTARENLAGEGIDSKIFLTGNTVVDAVKRYANLRPSSPLLSALHIKPKRYFLVTAHRAENIDAKTRLADIFEGLALLEKEYSDLDMIYPIHPRTAKKSKEFGLRLHPAIRVIEPVGYFDMLHLEKNARLIISDSGGIQEEATVLRVPMVTIRDTTERPETIRLGFNTLVPGVEPRQILAAAKKMLTKKYRWSNPFGDGKAGERIVAHLKKLISSRNA